MKISDLVDLDRGLVGTVTADCPALLACSMMASRQVGALAVVEDDGRITGMFSERDVIAGLHNAGVAIFERPVSELMTADVISCGADTEVRDAAELMIGNRVRHLPVVDKDGYPLTIVSIRDIVTTRLATLEADNEVLRAQLQEVVGG
jgi:CBS domain-containing protein